LSYCLSGINIANTAGCSSGLPAIFETRHPRCSNLPKARAASPNSQSTKSTTDHTAKPLSAQFWTEIMTFDYGLPAELFMAKRKGGARSRLISRRFATAAEAIRFAVEDFPAIRALGAWMQVGSERFSGEDIHRLYESHHFPLRRRID
jgi:hypothetical protein